MTADALELALALHQAPIQRFALRDRPLPENIGEVLQLASAMQPQLELAAARFQVSEDTIVEAVRFYLHQILFEPGTDAYRILGLSPDADTRQIRQHHVWLQRWLHPDRCGEDWEAVFSTKVNWAWQQIRNEASRSEYDLACQGRGPKSTVDEVADEALVQVPAWNAEPISRNVRNWPRRLAIGSLLVVCAGLFYLAVTQVDQVDLNSLPAQNLEAETAIQPTPPFAEITQQRTPGMALARTDLAIEPTPVDRAVAPIATAVVKDGVTLQGSGAGDVGAASAGVRQDGSTSIAPDPGRLPTAQGASFVATAVAADDARMPAAPRVDAGTSASIRVARKPAGAMGEKELRPVTAKRVAASLADPGISSDGGRSRKAAGLAAQNQQEANTPDNAAHLPALVPSERATGDLQVAGAAEASSPAPAAADVTEVDMLSRFELARKRVSNMVNYFRSQKVDLEDWNDAHGQHDIAQVRAALHARNHEVGIERFALDPPQWRVSDTAVSLNATYRVVNGLDAIESGQFNLDLAWREGNWKVTRIEVLPSR